MLDLLLAQTQPCWYAGGGTTFDKCALGFLSKRLAYQVVIEPAESLLSRPSCYRADRVNDWLDNNSTSHSLSAAELTRRALACSDLAESESTRSFFKTMARRNLTCVLFPSACNLLVFVIEMNLACTRLL